MDNIIIKDDLIYGFYSDLVSYLKKNIEIYVEQNNWEEIKEVSDLLLDLNGWSDYEDILVITNYNGMGYTIREYEKGL